MAVDSAMASAPETYRDAGRVSRHVVVFGPRDTSVAPENQGLTDDSTPTAHLRHPSCVSHDGPFRPLMSPKVGGRSIIGVQSWRDLHCPGDLGVETGASDGRCPPRR